ncbi:MAG: hypothetical protein ABEJ43_05210 [Haloferacaceae archaeon]
MTGLADAARESLAERTRREFDRRVAEQGEQLKDDIAAGRLDAADYAVGVELEAYAVDDEGRLARVSDDVFERAPCGKELGRHNVELNSDPTRMSGAGLADQSRQVDERVAATRAALDGALVLDAMWTVPPAGGSEAYLSATTEDDGVVVATEMRPNARYCALDNDVLARSGGAIELDLPGAALSLPSVLVESLATSIQPHLQVPEATAFPRYFNAALRTTGPLLALTTNSPLLPVDLYDDDVDPSELLEQTHHELRIAVFEQSINGGAPPGEGNVRLPHDLDATATAVDRIVDDYTYAPALVDGNEDEDERKDEDETADRYADEIPEFDRKRGIYWRWVRPVFGGQAVANEDGASVRMEYRPLPTQPTVADNVALQWLTVGLLRGLVETDHPLVDLPWEDAKACFYDAARRGPAADIAWVTRAGERTEQRDRAYDDLFATARAGLRAAGVDEATVDDRLAPVERRRETGPPSAWKLRRVRRKLDDGATFEEAVTETQRAYVERAASGTPFVEW